MNYHDYCGLYEVYVTFVSHNDNCTRQICHVIENLSLSTPVTRCKNDIIMTGLINDIWQIKKSFTLLTPLLSHIVSLGR